MPIGRNMAAAFNLTTEVTIDDDLCISDIGILEVVFLLMYTVITIVAVFGNAIVCYIVIADKRLRSVTNLFLLNMAFTDIIKSIVFVPLTFVPNLLFKYWPFGSFMCPFVLYTQIVAVFSSAFTLVAMSLDRYVAIIYPLRPKLTHKGAGFISVIVWILALLVPLPTAISGTVENMYKNRSDACQKGFCVEGLDVHVLQIYSMVIMFLQYFIPLTVLAYTYCRIGYVIWIQIIPGEALQMRDERMASSKRKMVKMMIVVVLLYAVCWLPVHVLQLVCDAHPEIYDNEKNIRYIWNAVFTVSASHSCYNPFVYFWMNKKFRQGYRTFFKKCLCCIQIGLARGKSTLSRQTSVTLTARNGYGICKDK